MSRVEELNQYIQELFDYWDGKNDDFEPIPIPKEVDDEMQRDSFMLWTERRWSEQSETSISPENPSMYSLNSYKSIQTKKRTASGNGCRPCVIMDL